MQPDPFHDPSIHCAAMLLFLLTDRQPVVWRARMARVVERQEWTTNSQGIRGMQGRPPVRLRGGDRVRRCSLLSYAKPLPEDWAGDADW